MTDSTVHVRYLVDDVAAAIEFYTKVLGFESITTFLPAFADVRRGNLRLLLSGPASSAGRPMPDGRVPAPGGWNRIHLLVDDIETEVARLREAGVPFRSEVVSGPGGRQIVLDDPAGNPVELFQPAPVPAGRSPSSGPTSGPSGPAPPSGSTSGPSGPAPSSGLPPSSAPSPSAGV